MIRVLIVDDSSLIRRLLTEILEQADDIEVVGTARDPYDARDKIKQLNPDVLTLDVEMPRMDGITFLRNLMRLRPMPVVMVSTLTHEGAEETIEALALGAVDFVAKPRMDVAHGLEEYAEQIVSKVRAAARARVHPLADAPRSGKATQRVVRPNSNKIVAIGASTGGTVAIQRVLEEMPPNAPAIVITQHMPEGFSAAFAQRLDGLCTISVCEAQDGQRILPGHAYIAPGGERHLEVYRQGTRYLCRLRAGAPVKRHRPSVEVLFESVVRSAGAEAIGVLLTGMGTDGADGMGRMHAAGALTIAQDEASSVVWGMPGAAVKAGAAARILPLDRIAGAILDAASAAPSTDGQGVT
ncbi:chemotaxis response regulator protein-glutamate methylesterase [Halorhodospira abdelmalekii]|uniref:protein-glutamate methylesterase/protein-glutamine glutaminase n=1 Tax=Halorhodospira abdelmalekii TaxID=421629 RepID=UPI001905740D|nr:chemotaxis response regulator protein-glutamate methylesterase [Halorhodospira abdelmalekii]MBK1734678.1 chemotaxis response regulator protein-glutamate methylesterase [Halorhodospira abdelmalekii]